MDTQFCVEIHNKQSRQVLNSCRLIPDIASSNSGQLLLLPRKTLHWRARWWCSRSEVRWRWNHWTWRSICRWQRWWRLSIPNWWRRDPRGHSHRCRRRCVRGWWHLWRGRWNLSRWPWWSTRTSSPIRQSPRRSRWWLISFRWSWLEVQLQLLQ